MSNPVLVLRPNRVNERMRANQDGVNDEMAFHWELRFSEIERSRPKVLREGKIKSSVNYHGALERQRE
jgi:hypothetical protein